MEVLTRIATETTVILAVPIALAIAGLAGAVLTKLFKKLGLDIEAQHRDTFQTMVKNAALDAVRRAGGPGVAQRIDDMHLIPAVRDAMEANPDAVKAFKASAESVEKRVLAQAVAIVQTTPTADVPASTTGGAAHRYADIDKKLAGLTLK